MCLRTDVVGWRCNGYSPTTSNTCTGANVWTGLTCVTNSIRGINLAGFNLVGSLPLSLNQFSVITRLDLSGNRLFGGVPSTVGTSLGIYGHVFGIV